MFTLTPVNGRKSFYGKCEVYPGGQANNAHIMYLRSYSTVVAEYDTRTKVMTVHGWYSMTTASHINAFLNHYGFPTTNKKGMQEWVPHAA